MASTQYASFQACRLRVARLTSGGAPDTGPDNLYVSDSLITLTSTPEVEAGEEFTQKNGCGAICATAKDFDRIKRVSLGAELCQLDAELLEMMTGASVLSSGGDTIGLALPSSSDDPVTVSVEAWSKAWDGGQQAVLDGDAAYWHWVWPSTTWVIGAHTIENGILRVPITGSGIENSGFGTGPGADMPGTIPGAEAVFLDTEIPAAVNGYQALVIAGS